MPLDDVQIERYSRQIILREVGGIGQEKLLAAHVQVAGVGAMAEWAARYLAAAGVGRLGLTAAGLAASLRRLNPDCRVHVAAPQGASVRQASFDVVVGCGAETVQRVGEICWRAGVPLVACDVRAGVGRVTVVLARDAASPCPVCAAAQAGEERGESGADAGAVLAPPVVAMAAATETLKLILGVGAPLVGRRSLYDPHAQDVRLEPVACRVGCRLRAAQGAAMG
jgi:adenylyltransferase/sulfurtransferase